MSKVSSSISELNAGSNRSERSNNREVIQSISVIVPVKDEQDTLAPLAENVFEASASQVDTVEIIFIDDGSQDNSWTVMQALTILYPGRVRALKLRRNLGKAAALEAGFKVAKGQVILTMDADLQDDPKEIPRFLKMIEGGLDLVSGWKRKRNDPLSKTLPSRLFNRITAWITGVPLHDLNCGFKAYRRAVIEQLKIYGELHRYIPVFANDAGFCIGEIEIEHHSRRHGVSKYGIERYARGFLDLITVVATTRYLQRPGHLFGGLGIAFGLLGGIIFGYLSVLWLAGYPIGQRPLIFVSFLLMIFSAQMISLGVIAELLIRLLKPLHINDPIVEVMVGYSEGENVKNEFLDASKKTSG